MKPAFSDPPFAASEARALIADAAATASDSLRRELAEQKDLNLRLAADFANFKRRSRQEAEDRARAEKESFIRELLPVVDNLERAFASGTSPDSPQFHQGVEMTLQQLRQLIRQHGIEPQESVGQQFDPSQHEAVSQRHDPVHPDQAILEVFERGYRRGEKVFRPAKVVVNERLTR
jgi:molecular chaperone GrpE